MRILNAVRIQDPYVRPQALQEEEKIVLGISTMLLLAEYFAISYVGQTYFSYSLLDIYSPGFWLLILNSVFITSLVLVNKKAAGWSWSKLGLAKPVTWWAPLAVAGIAFIAVLLLSFFVQPYFMTLGSPVDISHLMVINNNLPLLLLSLITIWICSAFLEELVFRAFLINALDIIFGRNKFSPWLAVALSSVIFGLMHAWQGLGGILTTACIGVIFGTVYLFNGRRIWGIVLVHGIIDTITVISIYNM